MLEPTASAAAAGSVDTPAVAESAEAATSVTPGHDQEKPDEAVVIAPAIGAALSQAKELDIADPFAYLTRDAYTTEIYKIEINNLPKRYGIAELKKRLVFLKLKPKKVKAAEHSRYAFVTFSCAEDKEAALAALNGHVWKGFTLAAKAASPSADPLMKKRKLANAAVVDAKGDDVSGLKHAKTDISGSEEVSERSLAEQMYDAVIPLRKMPYPEQLELKQKDMSLFLGSLGKQVQKCYRDAYVPRHLIKDDFNYSGRMDPIKPSPTIDSYRNKCEFTVGRHPVSNEPVVGFRLSDYKSGSCAVMDALDGCVHIPARTIAAAKAFQTFVRQSVYEPFDPVTKKGNWRCLMVRTCRNGDIMAALSFVSADGPKETVESAKDELSRFFRISVTDSELSADDSPPPTVKLASLYFQLERSANDASPPPPELLIGKQFIIEDLGRKKFRVSPDSFLQVNTEAAAMLYDLVGTMCCLSESTTLLDVCCGTGTIGLILAQTVRHVVGIDVVSQAVADAKANAILNGSDNVEFICGKAEDVLPEVLVRHANDISSDVVAIVDPPRAGLHNSVLQAIRRNKALRRLVYVSCSPTSAQANFVDLLRPESRRMKGPAFTLVRAVPVDLFPHTKHCELVLLFERAATPCGTLSESSMPAVEVPSVSLVPAIEGDTSESPDGDQSGSTSTEAAPIHALQAVDAHDLSGT